MRKRRHRVLLCAGLAGLLAAGCGDAAESEKAGGEGAATAHAELRREPDGSVVISFDEEALHRLALEITGVTAASLTPEHEAYGRVLDPAPFVALVAEQRTASSNLDVAARELERSRRLVADQNVSVRAADAAAAAATQARVTLDDVRSRLVMGWGGELAARTDLDALVEDLVSRRAVLVRVDLPIHRALEVRGVHFAFADAPDEPITASLLGPTPDVDPKVQGQGFLALVSPNSARLAPGAFLTAFLELEGQSVPAALVPRAAVVRAEGKAWVYEQEADAKSFHRVEVSLDRATPAGWLVTHGTKPGARVVAEGAQQLLSEEALASGRVRD